jgi:2-oxoglutarate ferredoxin oxidoreductase subunit alpha
MNRLRKKYETARGLVPKPVIDTMDGARFGIISFGSCDPAVQEARDNLAKQGIQSDYLRVRALPFTQEITEFIHSHAYTYVVELNRDGQMRQLISLEVPECAASLISLAHLDGLPLSAEWVEDAIRAREIVSKEA